MASALGYERRFRRLLLIQRCLFMHVRRLLVLTVAAPLDLFLQGADPQFGLF